MLVSRVIKQHWNQWPLTDSIFFFLYRNYKDIHEYLETRDAFTSGFTDLHWAAITGQSQVIQSLVTEGSDTNAEVGIRNALLLKCESELIPGGPEKKGTVNIRLIFRTLLLSTVLLITLLDRASSSHYSNTNIITFGWEPIMLWVICMDCHLRDLLDFPEARCQIPKMTVHKKLLIKQNKKFSTIQLGKIDSCCSE